MSYPVTTIGALEDAPCCAPCARASGGATMSGLLDRVRDAFRALPGPFDLVDPIPIALAVTAPDPVTSWSLVAAGAAAVGACGWFLASASPTPPSRKLRKR